MHSADTISFVWNAHGNYFVKILKGRKMEKITITLKVELCYTDDNVIAARKRAVNDAAQIMGNVMEMENVEAVTMLHDKK